MGAYPPRNMKTMRSMSNRQFKQVDVFTAVPYMGNPLAVVLEASGLSDAQMQRFAQWTNLSETTFLLPPTPQAAAQGADYRVRIFTPGGELPFAGHPTLGSCHAWLQWRQQADPGSADSGRTVFVQECGVGLVRIRRSGSQLAFAAPAITRNPVESALLAQVAQALGLDVRHIVASQLLDNGPLWLGLLIDQASVLSALQPNHVALKNLGIKVGLAHIQKAPLATVIEAQSTPKASIGMPGAPAKHGGDTSVGLLVRAFAAPVGINEDPVTGSLNASLAQWLMADGLLPADYTATQGTSLGRHGQVHIHQDATGQVWVGGESVTCIDGTVCL